MNLQDESVKFDKPEFSEQDDSSFLQNLGRDIEDLVVSIPEFFKLLYGGLSEWARDPGGTVERFGEASRQSGSMMWSGLKDQYTDPQTGRFDLGRAFYTSPFSTVLDATAIFDVAGGALKMASIPLKAMAKQAPSRLLEMGRAAGVGKPILRDLSEAVRTANAHGIARGAARIEALARASAMPELATAARQIKQYAKIEALGDTISRLPGMAIAGTFRLGVKKPFQLLGKIPALARVAENLGGIAGNIFFDPSWSKFSKTYVLTEQKMRDLSTVAKRAVEEALGNRAISDDRWKLVTEAHRTGQNSASWNRLTKPEQEAVRELQNWVSSTKTLLEHRGILPRNLSKTKFGEAVRREPTLREIVKGMFDLTDEQVDKFYQLGAVKKRVLDFVSQNREGILKAYNETLTKLKGQLAAMPGQPIAGALEGRISALEGGSGYLRGLPAEGITAEYLPLYKKHLEDIVSVVTHGEVMRPVVSFSELKRRKAGLTPTIEGRELAVRFVERRSKLMALVDDFLSGRLAEALSARVWKAGDALSDAEVLLPIKAVLQFLTDETVVAREIMQKLPNGTVGSTALARGAEGVLREFLSNPDLVKIVERFKKGELGEVWAVPRSAFLEFQRRVIGNAPSWLGSVWRSASDLFKTTTLAFGLNVSYLIGNVVGGAIQFLLSGGTFGALKKAVSGEFNALLPARYRVSPAFLRWNQSIERIPNWLKPVKVVLRKADSFNRFANLADDLYRKASFLTAAEREARRRVALEAGDAFFDSLTSGAKAAAMLKEVLKDARMIERIERVHGAYGVQLAKLAGEIGRREEALEKLAVVRERLEDRILRGGAIPKEPRLAPSEIDRAIKTEIGRLEVRVNKDRNLLARLKSKGDELTRRGEALKGQIQGLKETRTAPIARLEAELLDLEKLAVEQVQVLERARVDYASWKQARRESLVARVMERGGVLPTIDLPRDFPKWLKRKVKSGGPVSSIGILASDFAFRDADSLILAVMRDVKAFYETDGYAPVRDAVKSLDEIQDNMARVRGRITAKREAVAGSGLTVSQKAALERGRALEREINANLTQQLVIHAQIEGSLKIAEDLKVRAATIGAARAEELVTLYGQTLREMSEHPLRAKLAVVRAEETRLQALRRDMIAETERLRGRIDGFLEEHAASYPRLASAAQAVQAASEHADRFLFNYYQMSSAERNWARNVLPFWYWTRNSMKLMAQLPFIAPTRTFGWMFLSDLLADLAHDTELPDELRGHIPIGVDEHGHLLWVDVRRIIFPLSMPNFKRPEDTLLWRMNPMIQTAFDVVSGRPVFGKVKPGKGTFVTTSGQFYEFDPVNGVLRKKPALSVYSLPEYLGGVAMNFYPFAFLKNLTRPYVRDEANAMPAPEGALDADGHVTIPYWAAKVLDSISGARVRTEPEVEARRRALVRLKAGLIRTVRRAMRRNPEDIEFYRDVLRMVVYQKPEDF